MKRICLYVCDGQVQDSGGGVPEPRPGGQRFGPSALHERGFAALCWGSAEPQLSGSAEARSTALWSVCLFTI